MRYLNFFLAALICIGCNQNETSSSKLPPANVDSLAAEFLTGWNNHDSAAIMNTIADEAVVMNDSLIFKGKQQIAANWVSNGVKFLSNIKTSAIISKSDEKLAFTSGTYTLDLNPPGGPLLKENGNFNLTWAREGNDAWKLIFIHIEDISRMPDLGK